MRVLGLLPAVIWWLACSVRASGNGQSQNYASFSSGLDQDGGLQPAVGG